MFYLFGTILLLLLGVVCYYFGRRIYQWLHCIRQDKEIRKSVFWPVFSLLILLLLIIQFMAPPFVGQIFKAAAGYGFGVLFYLLFFIVFIDIFRFILKCFKYRPSWLYSKRGIFTAGLVVIIGIAGLVGCGAINGRKVVKTDYNIAVNKSAGENNTLKIAVVSDIHLGNIIGLERMKEIVSIINSQEVDIVCIAGDIFDNNFANVSDTDRIRKEFLSIKSKYGVYAVFGNHDAGSTVSDMISFLDSANVTLLEDESVTVDNRFILMGRKDRMPIGGREEERLSLEEMSKNLDMSKPVIVMDHQPDSIEETKAIGADLMLSGHTHAGQFFPVNMINRFLYRNDYGYEKTDNLHTIVSSGAGSWGPPIRIGSKCEVVTVNIIFDK